MDAASGWAGCPSGVVIVAGWSSLSAGAAVRLSIGDGVASLSTGARPCVLGASLPVLPVVSGVVSSPGVPCSGSTTGASPSGPASGRPDAAPFAPESSARDRRGVVEMQRIGGDGRGCRGGHAEADTRRQGRGVDVAAVGLALGIESRRHKRRRWRLLLPERRVEIDLDE